MRKGKSFRHTEIDAGTEPFFKPRHRQVSIEEGEKRAKQLNMLFIETSARAGHNVSEK
jgi:hypothetical protein